MKTIAMKHLRLIVATLISVTVSTGISAGQNKNKDEKGKNRPKIMLAIPFGVSPGMTTSVTLRGLNLHQAKEICSDSKEVQLQIKKKAKVPDNNPRETGDTEVVLTVTTPAKLSANEFSIVVKTSSGDSEPFVFLVDHQRPIDEQETNDGFGNPQTVPIPAIVAGKISRPKDVDVYKIRARAGEKYLIEILANRKGSLLDSMITIYNSRRQQMAFNDDANQSHDSSLILHAKNDEDLWIVCIDAHDQGGPTHPYRLIVRRLKER